MRIVFAIRAWTRLFVICTMSLLLTSAVLAQDNEPVAQSNTVAKEQQADWINDAIKIVEFIADNQLILRDNSYAEYEKLVLTAPSEEKLDRLYELLIDAMFVGSKDVTEKYLPIYIAEIEKSGSTEHRQTLNVLTVATQGYIRGAYDEALKALETILLDETTHPFARVRALSIVGYLYGYTANTDQIVTTIRKMESIAKTTPDNIFIKKEIISLKGLLAFYANDPAEMVKYSGEFLKLAYQTNSLIFGEITSENFTLLVMEYGDVASIDRIDALNRRIAHMTGDKFSIFKAYTRCGESAVNLVRNEKALKCFDEVENYNVDNVQAQIRYYLYSAIAYARDRQVEKARTNLEKAKKTRNGQVSVYFGKNIDWATSEVLQAEGEYVEAYSGLRSYFNTRISSQKKELGEVTKSLRAYSEDKAALLQERTGLQDRVISRQRILIFLSALIGAILLGFVNVQRRNTIKLRKARQKTIKANRAIKSEARTDQLTRIGNRRAFYEYCSAISKNPEHREYTLAILDLDGFKLINDTYGHETGDVMIQETSKRLSDALEEDGQVFRLGGDEFAIVFLPKDDDELSLFKLCITNALKGSIKTGSKSFNLNWSVGAVRLEGDNHDPSAFLNQADYALYQAKEKQGPSFHIFSETDFNDIDHETRLAEEVLWNLNTSSFTMFGQVVVNAANGIYRPFGVEALLRAQTRSGEIIPPETFIRHAVSSGKGLLLSKTTLLKSIEMLKLSGLECPLLFNLSAEQITNTHILDVVIDALKATNFPANRLIVELSEHTLNQDLSSASGTLSAFKKHGIRIALDDFGSANTGFSSLLEFDFDVIKTDRNLLSSAMESTRTKYLMSNLIDLSQKLNVVCIIEGLETPAEVSFIKSLGGQVLQGYTFGRPEETPRFRSNLHWAETPLLENADSKVDREDGISIPLSPAPIAKRN